MLKVNNENTRKRSEICSKLTIKTPERHHPGTSKIMVTGMLLLQLYRSDFCLYVELSNLIDALKWDQIQALTLGLLLYSLRHWTKTSIIKIGQMKEPTVK